MKWGIGDDISVFAPLFLSKRVEWVDPPLSVCPLNT